MKNSYLFILASLLWASVSSAGLLYNYSQLTLKDLDQMNEMAQKKLKEFKKDGSVENLKEAVQAIYSRPNDDGMVEKVISPLRTELDEHELWETTMDGLVQEAIGALKNPKAFKPVVQNTYAIFLENVIADFKPFAERPGHERKVIQTIRDAKIELSKEAINERKLRTMSNHKSPSEIATQVMNNISKMEADAKKAEEEAAKKAKK
ncbi:hypothetical protein [Bdellovibrio sp. HCB337]|uniref:hypothetical protein n=1 Tax=Bdellovibrio sp. HCB337 TaxID=3394358 RepID=UPI0039A5A90E